MLNLPFLKMGDWPIGVYLSTREHHPIALASVDGVVSMSRVDKESWGGALAQLLRVPALTPLLGSELEFSAEISGNFTDEYGAYSANWDECVA